MRVLLLGHPVAHSFSPVMQNAAFAALNRDDAYEAVDVPPGRLGEYLGMLRQGPYLGANVTVPYKLEAAAAMDELSSDAALLGAVNTIVAREGRLTGHNTDIKGAAEGLLEQVADSLLAARVLVLGAGGAARAVVAALARNPAGRPTEVIIAARRTEAAEEVLRLAGKVGLRARTVPWWELREVERVTDVIVNATPMGLSDEDDPLEDMPVEGRVVLDLVYRPGGTPLFRRAWAEGAMALQGDQMLLHQGAAAFQPLDRG